MLNKFWAIWPDPVWSKVIAAGIIALFVAIGSYFVVWFPMIGQWIVSGSSIPNWALIILSLMAVFIGTDLRNQSQILMI